MYVYTSIYTERERPVHRGRQTRRVPSRGDRRTPAGTVAPAHSPTPFSIFKTHKGVGLHCPFAWIRKRNEACIRTEQTKTICTEQIKYLHRTNQTHPHRTNQSHPNAMQAEALGQLMPAPPRLHRLWGLGCGARGFGFGVLDSGFGVKGLRGEGLGCRI